MTELETVASLPGVSAAVLSDLAGTFLGALGTTDGEAIAAEMGFIGTALQGIGELLGLGAFASFSLSGQNGACLLVARPPALLTALVSPAQSLGPVERALDTAFQAWS